MALNKVSKAVPTIATLIVAILFVANACTATPAPTSASTPSPTPSAEGATATPVSTTPTPPPTSTRESAAANPTPADRWSELAQRTPYPYSTPLPAAETTILDGTYTKVDPRQAGHIPCKRCPAYPPGGGVWKLSLDKGIFRIYHPLTGWVTIGSFTVTEDQINLFNDPHCFQDTGVYRWRMEDGSLTLTAVEDNCGVYLRAQNLEALPWESCEPPSTEAAITNHWPIPPGCESE
jgi:hypothetical protein